MFFALKFFSHVDKLDDRLLTGGSVSVLAPQQSVINKTTKHQRLLMSPVSEKELLEPVLSKLRPKFITVLSRINTLSCN